MDAVSQPGKHDGGYRAVNGCGMQSAGCGMPGRCAGRLYHGRASPQAYTMRTIMVDLEAAGWEQPTPPEESEIIEIGAVRLDSADGPAHPAGA